jgi:MFS family permease
MHAGEAVETNIPARLDRLPWSRWHAKIIIALGTSWLLDGLEVTLAGSLAAILKDKKALGLSDAQVGAAATSYLAGAVVGAMLFGYLTDRFGRRKLFLITLATYATATAATAFSWNFLTFILFRFVTGMGIGGEYAAINSAVDEFIPSKIRGTVDLIVNGTFWIGAALGSVAALFLLSGKLLPADMGWRAAFGVGAVLGALGNFFGPIAFGKLFDSVGRKPMITATYGATGALLAVMAFPFALAVLTTTLGVCLCVIFFIASSAASASYLTVSEIFPLEIRAFAIAIFYACGTLIGGVGAPSLFGALIQSGSRWHVSIGYLSEPC